MSLSHAQVKKSVVHLTVAKANDSLGPSSAQRRSWLQRKATDSLASLYERASLTGFYSYLFCIGGSFLAVAVVAVVAVVAADAAADAPAFT